MDFNLLSQYLLLSVCAIETGLIVYLFMQLFTSTRPTSKKDSKKTTKDTRIMLLRQLGVTLVVSLVISVLLMSFLSHVTGSSLPLPLLPMFFIAIFSVGLLKLVAIGRGKMLRSIGVVTLVWSVLFSLLLINNFYRFYPTLGEIFNKNSDVIALNDSRQEIDLQFTPQSHQTTTTQSIEASLATLNKQSTKGTVYSLNIPGTVSKFHARTAYVYVPAIYYRPGQINLPVIVLTPGFPGLTENWLGSGLETTMDAFAARHDGITPIVFMVDNTGSVANDTECVDSPRGNVETYLSVDVPNYIKKNFNVEDGPSHWAIGGLSLGGTCAIMLALRHPDVYHYFLDYGGEIGPEVGSESQTIQALFGGSEAAWQAHQPAYLLATHKYPDMGGFFGVGDQDTRDVTQAAAQLSTDSKNAGIETVYEVVNGQHTFTVWQDVFKLSLPWVSNRIGATQCGVNDCF